MKSTYMSYEHHETQLFYAGSDCRTERDGVTGSISLSK